MSMSTVSCLFSFLTTGPQLSFLLPDDFQSVPQLSSPLSNGVGARSFDFTPAWLDRDPITDDGRLRFVTTVRSGDGHVVEVHEMLDPWQWFLRWRLRKGSLYTHLRDQDGDGPERTGIIVGNLGVMEESESGCPFLLPEWPLASAVSAQPGYQEEALFFAPTRNDLAVTLRRPGYLPRGKSMILPDAGEEIQVLRVGVDFGIEMLIYSSSLERARMIRDVVEGSLDQG
jgi:hypothetical protein